MHDAATIEAVATDCRLH